MWVNMGKSENKCKTPDGGGFDRHGWYQKKLL